MHTPAGLPVNGLLVNASTVNNLISVFFCLIGHNARLYAVGRGFSARYESFRPNAVNRGERNPQYALEPRLPYTALLCPVFYFLVFMKLTISSVNPAFKGNSGFRYVAIFFCISESDSFNT